MANNIAMDFHQPVPQPNTTDHDLEIVLLRSKAEALAAEKKVLEQTLERTVEDKTELSSRLNEAVQERDELRRHRQANMLKIRKLGDMIVKNSQTSDEPLDEDILQDMYKVRNMTTEVIKKAYPDHVLIMPEVAKDLTKRFNTDYYTRFYIQRVMIDKGPERRRRLLISMLFEVLYDKFFDLGARRFGVPRDMETKLQEFERRIEENSKGSCTFLQTDVWVC
jgi:chromosome segregation ATPase